MQKEMKFCQSCGMPMEGGEAKYGTEADGSLSEDYCDYCYKNGQFTSDATMEEMIVGCVPFVVQAVPGTTPEKAEAEMRQFFPMLKRWRKD